LPGHAELAPLASIGNHRGMGYPGEREDLAARFGTEAFFASLGRAFVAMCAVIPVLFLI
jgi:hypothetical protein